MKGKTPQTNGGKKGMGGKLHGFGFNDNDT